MEPTSENKKIYEFGEFRLVPAEGLLLRQGASISLSPKAFEVLVFLVERNGHLVTKSEIIDQVWEDTFVEEGVVSKAVWFVRQALGDTSKERFIQTIPRRGYRFVAPVSVLNGMVEREGAEMISTGFRLPFPSDTSKNASETLFETQTIESQGDQLSESLSPDPLEHREKQRPENRWAELVARTGGLHKHRKWPLIAAVVVLVATGAGLYLLITGANILGKESAGRIAILPFKPVDAGRRDAIYDLGIAESLILKLGSDNQITVRPLNSVRSYTDINQDPLKAGRELKVDHILSANYQIADGKFKVTAQLLDVATGKVDDSYIVEGDAASSFAAQEAIADQIGKRIVARFGFLRREIPSKRSTDNEEAYRLYLQGLNLSEERGVQNVKSALQYFERAVALDPSYAQAWAAVAHLHRDMVGHIDSEESEHYQKSMAAIETALAIDPKLADAYSALCGNKLRYEYDLSGAEAACKKAIDLEPNSPLAYKNYAFVLSSLGRVDEAIAAIKKAMDIQPVSYRNQQIYALVLYFAGRHRDEEAQWRRLMELNPNHSYIYGRLAINLRLQGMDNEAFEFFVRKLTMDKVETAAIEKLKKVYASSGWHGVSLERINSTDPKTRSGTFDTACLYAGINENDKAFEFLEKAYSQRSHRLAMIRVDPQLDPLRGDPRFDEFVKEVVGPK